MPSKTLYRWCLFLFVTIASDVECQVDIANSNSVQCLAQRTSNDENFQMVDLWSRRLTTDMLREKSSPKGYLGTIAVIGTGTEKQGALYFTAMAALRAGADHVQIFCYSRSGSILKSLSPDISVYNFLDSNVGLVVQMLANVDLVILGPGLDNSAHSMTHVIPNVINHCKGKKPLVLDIRPDLFVAGTFNYLKSYPPPGVVITTNRVEFDALYNLIKEPLAVNTPELRISYSVYGKNIFILRKDCYDVGISANASTSWVSPERGGPKRSTGQGNVMAGILGTYFMWADKIIPINVTEQQGDMFAASVASYAAARATRQACSMATNAYSRGMTTSDMLERVADAINDPIES